MIADAGLGVCMCLREWGGVEAGGRKELCRLGLYPDLEYIASLCWRDMTGAARPGRGWREGS